MIEQGLTSRPTQYRLYGRQAFYGSKDPTDSIKVLKVKKGKGQTLVIAAQVDTATTKALRYMARTKQRRTYLKYLPSYSRYSFTDPERMEG